MTMRRKQLHHRGLFWILVFSVASIVLVFYAFRGSLVRLSSLDGRPFMPRTEGSWAFLEQSTLQEKRLAKRKGIPSSNATTTIRSTHHQVATTTTTTTATLADPRYNRTLTLLIPLSGELCNHLMLLAGAYIMKRYIERHIVGLSIQLLGQHERYWKWKRAYRDLKACFPNFRDFEFSAGRHDTKHGFAAIQKQQKTWLGTNASLLRNIDSLAQIDYLKSLLNQQAQEQQQQARGGRAPNQTAVPLGNNTRYSLPYLTSHTFMDYRSTLQDSVLYHELRDWLQFKSTLPQCCRSRAEADEVVFHFRNFVTEIEQASVFNSYNFFELSPNETAQYLFGSNHRRYGNHTSKRKMALISRFPDTATPFVETLQADGWTVRRIKGQSGVQDFCFAMSAHRELVGVDMSTYAKMAGFLGNATRVRLYRVARNPQDPDALGLWEHTRVGRLTALPGKRSFWHEEYARQEDMTRESLKAQAVALIDAKRRR